MTDNSNTELVVAFLRPVHQSHGTFPLYSKRQKQLRGEVPDAYVYDTFPNPFRVQAVHIWQDTLGNLGQYQDSYCQVSSTYEFIVQTLCREYAVFSLQDRALAGITLKNLRFLP